MAVKEYKVRHFQEFIEVVSLIGEKKKCKSANPPVLWFRGQRKQSWNLSPTLLRGVQLNPIAGTANASGRAMEEELRKQHYLAKNYHFLSKDPKTNIEWYEVMQHHGVKTRLLDWSESALHSLIFALECFFDEKQYHRAHRISSSPCVWVLEPIEWNIKAIKMVLSNTKLLDKCIDSLNISYRKRRGIKKRYSELILKFDDYIKSDSAEHLKAIFNMSSMMGGIQQKSNSELLYMLEKGELYYCLFYLLTFVYLSTDQKSWREVMPLSIVESYHSERIRAQKGAFSIFPYYEEDALYKSMKKMGIMLDAMEYMRNGNQFLTKIYLYNPDEIAYEVMNSGLNVSWLYPEMPVVANAIEQRKIFY